MNFQTMTLYKTTAASSLLPLFFMSVILKGMRGALHKFLTKEGKRKLPSCDLQDIGKRYNFYKMNSCQKGIYVI